MMRLLDEKSQIKATLANYPHALFEKVIRRLSAPDTTAEDVNKHFRWKQVRPWPCRECSEERWDVIQLGEEPSHDSATTEICADCLEKALAMLKGLE
jgi:hypothetical protein